MRHTTTSQTADAPQNSQLGLCKLCCRQLPERIFLERQWRKARAGKLACCKECQDAVLALKLEAAAALKRTVPAGQQTEHAEVLEAVSLETWAHWEQALEALCTARTAEQSWLPSMLRHWLDAELKEQQASKELPVQKEAISNLVPAWLDALRTERIIRYDEAAFPFRLLVETMFEATDLSQLHANQLSDRPPACPTLLRAYHLAGIRRPKAWRQREKWQKRHVQQFRSSASYLRFLEVYHCFLQSVIRPLLGLDGDLLYQCPPTLRCQMPSVVPMGRPHRDSDFGAHHGAEINIWVPATRVWGSNSLQVESEPGKGDFHPLELGPGEMVIFNGSQCLHFTEPNSTGSTRVSFDFRVIPVCLVDKWRHATNSGTTSELAQYEFVSTAAADPLEANLGIV